MARSTGPMLAAGAITWANRAVMDPNVGFDPTEPANLRHTARIAVATGLSVGVLAVIEKATPEIAVGLSYAALVTVLLIRVDRATPTPLERALRLVES